MSVPRHSVGRLDPSLRGSDPKDPKARLREITQELERHPKRASAVRLLVEAAGLLDKGVWLRAYAEAPGCRAEDLEAAERVLASRRQ